MPWHCPTFYQEPPYPHIDTLVIFPPLIFQDQAQEYPCLWKISWPLSYLPPQYTLEGFTILFLSTCLLFPERWCIPRGKRLCVTNLKTPKAWQRTWSIEKHFTNAFSVKGPSFPFTHKIIQTMHCVFLLLCHILVWLKSASSKLATWYCFFLSNMIGKQRRNTYFSPGFLLKSSCNRAVKFFVSVSKT